MSAWGRTAWLRCSLHLSPCTCAVHDLHLHCSVVRVGILEWCWDQQMACVQRAMHICQLTDLGHIHLTFFMPYWNHATYAERATCKVLQDPRLVNYLGRSRHTTNVSSFSSPDPTPNSRQEL